MLVYVLSSCEPPATDIDMPLFFQGSRAPLLQRSLEMLEARLAELEARFEETIDLE